MKSVASLNIRAMLVLGFLALLLQAQMGKSQTEQGCGSLANLTSCSPFTVPGAPEVPSQECCAAIQAVERDNSCFCGAMEIASRLPAKCNLPPLTCSTGN